MARTGSTSQETGPLEPGDPGGRAAPVAPDFARVMLDEMYQFVGILAPDGTTLEVNPSSLQAVGATPNDVLGKPFWETPWWTVSAALQERLRGLVEQAAQGAFVRSEMVHYGGGGGGGGGRELIHVDFSLKPVHGPDGSVTYLIAEGRDITERKRIEAEVARRNDEIHALYERLREYDRLKTQFFANVSHELRTPLALILGPLERWLTASEVAPNLREDLTVIQRNARILLRLVNDLLDISRLDAGKMCVVYQRCDLAKLIRETAANFDAIAGDRRISFIVRTPPELPASVDVDKLQRVLLNLLSNAFKFTPPGGRIRLSLDAAGDQAVLEVADSGPGVPVELRERIFDRFFQIEGGATRRAGGTGLGLGIAREFVLAHGGTIGVDDAPEGGARFRVEFPLKALAGATALEPLGPLGLPSAASQVAAELEVRAATATDITADEHAARILVVEDNVDMSRFLAQALGTQWRVACARDGQEGLERALQLRPDLIVTDVMMPHLSGEELLRELRRRPEMDATPVVVLTAKADDETRVQLLREGAQDYVMKPFSTDELRARVDTWLGVSRARKLLQDSLASRERDIDVLAAELVRRKDDAVQACEAKTAFLNLVSHELRTPLANMALQLKLMDMAGVPASLEKPVQRMDRAARRLQSLFDALLQYVRIKSGLAPPTGAEPTDLARVVADVIDDMQPQAAQKGLELRLESPPSLPLLDAHEDLVRVILSNVIDNAIKYTERGHITVSLAHGSDGHVLRVADTGAGIPAEQIGAIFEPFVQLDPLHRKHHPGVGLGLALVWDMVTSMGGRIDVQSEVGRGSTFTVVFPAAREAAK